MPFSPAHTYVNGEVLTHTNLNASLTEIADYAQQGLLNVLDYGASNNYTNATTTTAAINQAITDAATGGYDGIFLPRGMYSINGEITLPLNRALRIVGVGHMDTGAASMCTVLKRTAGYTGTILKGSGSGTSLSTFVRGLMLYGLQFHGNLAAGTGPLIDISHMEGSSMMFVHATNATTGGAWKLTTMWNVSMYRVRTTSSGSGTGTPAMLITGDPGGAAVQNTNTVDLVSCEWEANQGTSCKMTGFDTNQRTEGVNFSGGKAETGANNWTLFEFEHARMNVIQGMFMANTAGVAPLVVQSGGHINTITSCNFTTTTASTNFQMDITGTGGLIVNSCYFENWNTNAWGLRVGSSASVDGLILGVNRFYNNAQAIQDNRTGPRTIDRNYNRNVQATATAATTAIAADTAGLLATITVTGARVGDMCRASHTGSLQASFVLEARVTANDTVGVYAKNVSAGSLTPPAGTVKVVVEVSI